MEKFHIKATNQNGETSIGNVELNIEQAENLKAKFKAQLPMCEFEVIPTTETR